VLDGHGRSSSMPQCMKRSEICRCTVYIVVVEKDLNVGSQDLQDIQLQNICLFWPCISLETFLDKSNLTIM
jgi:hypothetical protein